MRNPAFLNDKINDRINDKINDKINDNTASLDEKILRLIDENKYITAAEIAEITGKSATTVYRHITALTGVGKIKRVGSRKSGYWKTVR